LLIDLEGPAKKLYSDPEAMKFREFRRSWISGQHSRFIVIGAEQNSSMMGIHFRPGGAYPFLRFPVAELNDQVVDMEVVWGPLMRDTYEQIVEAKSPQRKFEILERALLISYRHTPRSDDACMYAIARLRDAEPALTIRALAKELGFSQRQLL